LTAVPCFIADVVFIRDQLNFVHS